MLENDIDMDSDLGVFMVVYCCWKFNNEEGVWLLMFELIWYVFNIVVIKVRIVRFVFWKLVCLYVLIIDFVNNDVILLVINNFVYFFLDFNWNNWL